MTTEQVGELKLKTWYIKEDRNWYSVYEGEVYYDPRFLNNEFPTENLIFNTHCFTLILTRKEELVQTTPLIKALNPNKYRTTDLYLKSVVFYSLDYKKRSTY
ncbi:hypothetical protein VQL36_20335 [Chengkuizengella sp. SCS-71B]|uniref:hypothetical protein n=1 Tax=Chengkuizengella sp. SCS-71B TaxID=3115290 RepID=UPI0032C22C74